MFNVSKGDGPLFFGFGKGGMDIKNYSFMVRNGEFNDSKVGVMPVQQSKSSM